MKATPLLSFFIPVILISCGILAISDPDEIEFHPSGENTILSSTDTISVSFPFTLNHAPVEALFQVKDFGGTVPGRFLWEGSSCRFQPEPSLTPGSRYVFSFNGTVQDTKGQAHTVHHIAPFFYIYRSDQAPHITSISPSRGQVVSTHKVVEVTFDRDMDPVSFEAGFRITPEHPCDFQWTAGTKQVQIIPRKGWEDRTLYTLSFPERITDRSGMPLGSTSDITFLVQEDTDCPSVVSVEAALNDGDSFSPLGSDLSASLRYRDAIRITFSEPMNQEQTREAVTLSPSIPGDWFWWNDKVLIFCPATGYDGGSLYTLSIDDSARDISENPLLPFSPLSFTPRIDSLHVTVELVEDQITFSEEECSSSQPVEIHPSPPTWADYTLVVTFSGGYFQSDAEKLSAQTGIRFSCLFPPSAPSPIPLGFSWVGDNRLSITYTGFIPSSSSSQYYYLLVLNGGPSGIRATGGNRLNRDISQLFVTGVP
jgi:hypothetical protein